MTDHRDDLADLVREVASGQRQATRQLKKHLERGVRLVLKHHFGERRDLKRLTERIVAAIIDGVARGEVADFDEFGAYARRIALGMKAEPASHRGMWSRVQSLLPTRERSEQAPESNTVAESD